MFIILGEPMLAGEQSRYSGMQFRKPSLITWSNKHIFFFITLLMLFIYNLKSMIVPTFKADKEIGKDWLLKVNILNIQYLTISMLV